MGQFSITGVVSAVLARLRTRVAQGSGKFFVLYTGLAAFSVYSCMYAFRKPFTAAGYDELVWLGFSYKIWLVTAQAAGYVLSKFIGIGVIGSLSDRHRPRTILLFISAAWLALLGFALTPAPYNLFFMFLNGLPLGMVWGVVFSYLEGRATTEILGAILATSLIFASGFSKFVGKSIMVLFGVNESWMPFATGVVFILPLLSATLLLHAVPPPTAEDLAQRHPRAPMNSAEKKAFLRFFGAALLPTIAAYMFLSVLRDVRDNFANEIWVENGFDAMPSVFALSETCVALIVLGTVAFIFKIKDNYRAFAANHLLIIFGLLASGVISFLFLQDSVSAFAWMTGIGIALYTAYIPYSCLFFERMIASYQTRGNVGFVMYIADAFAYLAAMGVLIFKEFSPLATGWSHFLAFTCVGAGIVGTALVATGWLRFHRLRTRQTQATPVPHLIPILKPVSR